jgi:hypothetical protein
LHLQVFAPRSSKKDQWSSLRSRPLFYSDIRSISFLMAFSHASMSKFHVPGYVRNTIRPSLSNR